ncbi:divalent-cation tolerance protein CutA [Afifella sp. IM 167]|uniref:divalent-cation tolerance protein CutA n=1 Tax=Afifella sp. IM 167 TaxID=2033586 RepID=UPI001CCD9C0B|nr:divalent-cation tolerance protein CutA [Afifella sp. IM 167]MBZ8132314.1 divalent-cation tolerance protein CutA [Afifella sp. IM 167]
MSARDGEAEANRLALLYIPCPDLDTARRIGAKAVEARLAACANILPAMISLYRWKGAIEEENEAVLILKTAPEREAALRKEVAGLHPYEVPAILTLEAPRVNAAYADWVKGEVGD